MGSLDLNNETGRQRRNLNAIAGIIIFIELADVSFGDTINVLGAVLVIGRPESIPMLLNVALAYYLWRYYQYFSSDKAFYAIKSQFKDNYKHAVSMKIVRLICTKLNVNSLNGEYSYEKLDRAGKLSYIIKAELSNNLDPATGDKIKEDPLVELPLLPIELARIGAVIAFLFRGRILTDFLVPYFLVIMAISLKVL